MSSLDCRGVTGLPADLPQLAGARVCGFVGSKQPDMFSACCSGAIYDGSEAPAADQQAAPPSTGCLTYCITDLSLTEFTSCLSQQPDFRNSSKTFCSGDADPFHPDAVSASAISAASAASSRLMLSKQAVATLIVAALAVVAPYGAP
ncbi:uncharacterized protein PFL1_00293 [Pseudozyma flocculosa PF-1]|uniref:Uncharacterized protein n=1 Tax=Pseudozyma flocculosa TaxID=84751 RepID=A0A5C3ERN5_9BASI|nr:uncharacterized protein PFL1_00293 [Pseudozyma flocculosa PF-1]EPQ32096.1 hypothetical protein PFL1_00293 [Pseudozyma flocculosa PF-1]SPO34973.1 uncharacterized protein PSFLO_00444 [Pseudozyma flocculosa]